MADDVVAFFGLALTLIVGAVFIAHVVLMPVIGWLWLFGWLR